MNPIISRSSSFRPLDPIGQELFSRLRVVFSSPLRFSIGGKIKSSLKKFQLKYLYMRLEGKIKGTFSVNKDMQEKETNKKLPKVEEDEDSN